VVLLFNHSRLETDVRAAMSGFVSHFKLSILAIPAILAIYISRAAHQSPRNELSS
jgi:hypothetical protein